jgi:cell division protein FtsB
LTAGEHVVSKTFDDEEEHPFAGMVNPKGKKILPRFITALLLFIIHMCPVAVVHYSHVSRVNARLWSPAQGY